MIIHDHDQGSPEWFACRAGIPTASRFSDIYTSTGKPSASADKYMNLLLAERLSSVPLESFSSEWMSRGTELEPKARTYYEFIKDVEVEETGFITLDDCTVGGSPDGLTKDGGLEIKCPSPAIHIGYLLKGKCPATYLPQVQGLMWICQRDSWDFMSYHPDIEKQLIVTVKRDEEWIKGFTDTLAVFQEKLNTLTRRLEDA